MTKWILGLSVLLLVFGGCADDDDQPRYTPEELAQIPQPVRSGLPKATGGFVLAVGTDTISSEEIIGLLYPKLEEYAQKTSWEDFSKQAIIVVAKALRDRVADSLLYQQAKKQAGEQIDEQLNAYVEKEMRRFIVSFGGDYAKAQAFLMENYGMDWEQFRAQQRRMILSGSFIQQQLKEETPITYNDIKEYYDSVKDEKYKKSPTITIRLIDIDISKIKIKDGISQHELAAQKALDIMDKLKNGEDFGELAKQYSDGYRASVGGLWKPVNPESFAKPYDILALQAEGLVPGDLAGPLEAEGHIFIMRLEDRKTQTEVPLEEVQKEIEQQIIQERKLKNLDKVMSKVMEEASISGLDPFARYCVEEIYLRANPQ